MKFRFLLRLLILLIFCAVFPAAAENENENEEETEEPLPPALPRVLFSGTPDILDKLFVAAASGTSEIEIVNAASFQETMRTRGLPALSGPSAASVFPDSGLICIACPGKNGRTFFSFYNASCGFLAGRLYGTPEDAVAMIPPLTEKITGGKKFFFSIGHLAVPPELAPHRAAFLYEFASALASAPEIQVREQSLLDFAPDTGDARLPGEIRLDVTLSVLHETHELQISYQARGGGIDSAEPQAIRLPYTPPAFPAGAGTRLARAAASLAGIQLPDFPWDPREETEKLLAFYHAALSLPNEWDAARLPVWFGRLAPVLDLLSSLSPDNREVRYEKIFYEACSLHENVSAEEKLRRLESCMDDIRKFNAVKNGPSRTFERHPVCPVRPFEQILFSSAKASEQARFSALLAQIRAPESTAGGAEVQLPPKGPAPASWQELLRLHERIASIVRNAPRADALQTVKLCYEAEIRELTAVRDFKRKNPKAPLETVSWGGYFPYDRQLNVTGRAEAWDELRRILREEGFARYEALCTEIGTEALSGHLLEVKTLRDYLLSGMSVEDLKNAYRKKLDILFRRNFTLRPHMILCGFLADAVHALPSGTEQERALKSRLLLSYPYEYAFQTPSLSLKQKLLCLSEAGCRNPLWLAAEAERIRSMAYDMIADRDANNTLALLAEALYANTGDADVQKALAALNAPFEVRETATPGVRTLAACNAGGKIFLLQENSGRRMILTEYDPVSGVCRDCGMPDVPADEFQSARRLSGTPEPCSLTFRDGWIFAGGERMLLLRNTKTSQWFKITDLEAPFPVCAAVHAGRIYCLCGGSPGPDGQDKYVSMLSFLPDGSDRKVIFNGARNGMHALDALRKGRVSGFFTAPGGEWFFTVHSRNRYCRVYAFRPAKNTFRIVGSFPRAFELFSLRLNESRLLGQGGGGFFRFRLSPPAPDWFFSQVPEDGLSVPNRIPGCMSLRMPALEAGGLLIAAGGLNPLAVNVKNPEKSPFLILPPCVDVFHVPARHMLVFPARSGKIYTVTADFL